MEAVIKIPTNLKQKKKLRFPRYKKGKDIPLPFLSALILENLELCMLSLLL